MIRILRIIALTHLIFFAGYFLHKYQSYHFISPTTVGHVDALVYSESLTQYVDMWRAEVARRFPDAVLIVSHGNDIDGQWQFVPDMTFGPVDVPLAPIPVKDEVKRIQAKYPGRTIVIMSCNPGHYHLSLSNVAYALDSVWCVPDKIDAGRYGDASVGNVFEFEFNN